MKVIGKDLNSKQTKDKINKLKTSEKFKNVITELQKYATFQLDLSDIITAIHYDIGYKEDVVTGETIELKLGDNVTVSHTERYVNADKGAKRDFVIGTIITPNDQQEVDIMNIRANESGYVSIKENKSIAIPDDVTSLGKLDDDFYDKDYYPEKLLETANKASAFDGCLSGGYIWCGGNCGGSAACKSTKNGINALDNCCKAHDCCYSNFGIKKPFHCICDQRLCDCAQKTPWSGWKYFVQAYFCFVC